MRFWTWMLLGCFTFGLAGCGGDDDAPVPDNVTTEQPDIDMGTLDDGTQAGDGSTTTTDPNSDAPAFDPNSEAPAFDPTSEAPPFDSGADAAPADTGKDAAGEDAADKDIKDPPPVDDSSRVAPVDQEAERTALNEAPLVDLLVQLADAARRDEATAALRNQGSAVVPELVAALDHGDWQVRAGAVFALSLLEQEAQDALPKLRKLAETEEQESVRDAAAWAIDAIAQNP